MAWSLGRGTRSVLSVCERHLDVNTVKVDDLFSVLFFCERV